MELAKCYKWGMSMVQETKRKHFPLLIWRKGVTEKDTVAVCSGCYGKMLYEWAA